MEPINPISANGGRLRDDEGRVLFRAGRMWSRWDMRAKQFCGWMFYAAPRSADK
jgi:hypothetical protein